MQQGDFIDFPGILGKKASEVEQLLLISNFKPNEHMPRWYILNDTIKNHFGFSYQGVNFQVDEHQTVNSITLSSYEVVNKETFEALKEHFGEPSAIKVIDQYNLDSNSSDSDSNDGHSFRKGYATLKDATFEDNPFIIYWDKVDYEVILRIRYAEQHHLGFSRLNYRYPIKQ